MKRFFYFAAVLMMAISFVSCSDDEVENEFSWEEFFAYYEENRAYIREKKAKVDENGNLLYNQLVVSGDTVLYRVLSKSGTTSATPNKQTVITTTLKGELINGSTFQPQMSMELTPSGVIEGLGAVLLKNTVGETVEAIIPSTLGYGYEDYLDIIPGGSTLIFTYTIENFN